MGFSLALRDGRPASPVPLYYQLAQHLERAIGPVSCTRGTQLGNEILLADQLGLPARRYGRAIG